MREVRATCVQPNLVDAVQPIPGLLLKGNRILGVNKQQALANTTHLQQVTLPRYNAAIHRPGDDAEPLQ